MYRVAFNGTIVSVLKDGACVSWEEVERLLNSALSPARVAEGHDPHALPDDNAEVAEAIAPESPAQEQPGEQRRGWVPALESESKGAFLTGIPGKPIYAVDERAEPYCWWRFDLPDLPPPPERP